MFFRNLTLFRFPTSLNLADLDAQLAECELKPVGALAVSYTHLDVYQRQVQG